MKLFTALRALLIACALAATTQASALPTLVINGSGTLTGAQGVNVAGTLYDVTFAESSCITLFAGCSASSFNFTTAASATAAAQALLDQVLIDGPGGPFDSHPVTVFGCAYTLQCATFIPYATYTTYPGEGISFHAMYSRNYIAGYVPDFVGQGNVGGGGSFANDILSNIAVFTLSAPAAPVPEPGSLALLCIGIAAWVLTRRRKARGR